MFYVFNVHEWLTEVITACNENQLSPEESLFALALFSSLDEEHVRFFRDRKSQVSSYSGENVHIFTPIIYEDVIPDNEWRELRDDFNRAGIEQRHQKFEPVALLQPDLRHRAGGRQAALSGRQHEPRSWRPDVRPGEGRQGHLAAKRVRHHLKLPVRPRHQARFRCIDEL